MPDCPRLEAITADMFRDHVDPARPADMSPVLNAMFDYARLMPDVKVVDWRGTWNVERPVRADTNERVVVHSGDLVAGPGFQGSEVLMIAGDGVVWSGNVRVDAKGRADNCVSINCWRGQFVGFEVRNARRHGVHVNFGISTDLGTVSAFDCGSAAGIPGAHNAKQVIVWADAEDNTTAPSVSQRTTVITHDTRAENLRPGDIVFHEDVPYVITLTTYDPGADAWGLQVYPRILRDSDAGSFVLSHGAAINAGSSNCSGLSVAALAVQRCGVALKASGLYGGRVGSIVAESSGIGIQVGGDPGGLHRGTSVNHAHFEGVAAHVVKVTRTPAPVMIDAMAVWDASKLFGMAPNDATKERSWGWRDLDGISLGWRGTYENQVTAPRNQPDANPIVLANGPRSNGHFLLDNPTFLLHWDDDANRAFGYQSFDVVLTGKGAGNSPGHVVLQTPIPAAINGQAQVGKTFDAPVRIVGVYDVDAQNWIVHFAELDKLIP